MKCSSRGQYFSFSLLVILFLTLSFSSLARADKICPGWIAEGSTYEVRCQEDCKVQGPEKVADLCAKACIDAGPYFITKEFCNEKGNEYSCKDQPPTSMTDSQACKNPCAGRFPDTQSYNKCRNNCGSGIMTTIAELYDKKVCK